MNCFDIDGRLPTRNDEINAGRTHWAAAAKQKSSAEKIVIAYARNAAIRGYLKPIEKPCYIVIEWHEKTKKRDADNIQSSSKYILDALQKCGILKNDNQKNVRQVIPFIVPDHRDFSRVILFENFGDFAQCVAAEMNALKAGGYDLDGGTK